MHFAFERKGDLSAFKNKQAKVITVRTIEEIEDRVQIYLAKEGMAAFKNHPRITHQSFKEISDEVNLTFLVDN